MRSSFPSLKKLFVVSALSGASLLGYSVAGQSGEPVANTSQNQTTIRTEMRGTEPSAKDRAVGILSIFALAALSVLGPAYMIHKQKEENTQQAREADKLSL